MHNNNALMHTYMSHMHALACTHICTVGRRVQAPLHRALYGDDPRGAITSGFPARCDILQLRVFDAQSDCGLTSPSTAMRSLWRAASAKRCTCSCCHVCWPFPRYAEGSLGLDCDGMTVTVTVTVRTGDLPKECWQKHNTSRRCSRCHLWRAHKFMACRGCILNDPIPQS
jgi:hypothetical protein